MRPRSGAAEGFGLKAVLAFAAVYVVWGSTYLVIRIGVADTPPMLFAAARFLPAGLLLALIAYTQGQRFPRDAREWRTIIVVGLSMLATGNGLVVWGEQWVPSNQAALLVASVALWIAGFGTLGGQGQKLSRREWLGLAIGFIGTALLLLPAGGFSVDHLAAQLGMLAASISWAAGSIYAKREHPRTPPLMSAAMQSLVAAAALATIGFGRDEASVWEWSPTLAWTLAYLILLGSCVAYASYIWLLHNVSPAALGTYGYVNPAVAVVLGWWILDEHLTPTQMIGMTVILLGVVMVSLSQTRGKKTPAAAAPRP